MIVLGWIQDTPFETHNNDSLGGRINNTQLEVDLGGRADGQNKGSDTNNNDENR